MAWKNKAMKVYNFILSVKGRRKNCPLLAEIDFTSFIAQVVNNGVNNILCSVSTVAIAEAFWRP